MRHSCLWSTFALVAIILCLVSADDGEQLYKVNEVGQSPVDFKLCGDYIIAAYNNLCPSLKRKRRSMAIDEKEALSFLEHQTQRHRRSDSTDSSGSGSTNILEECCNEGCAYEEVYEYC